jgi:pilus assembly protein Flp/PilA
MKNAMLQLKALIQNEEGQDIVEYALVIALLSFGLIAGLTKLAGVISTNLASIGSQM